MIQDRLKSRFFHKPSGKYLNQNDLVYCNGKYHLISYSRDSNGILFPYILTSFNESEIIEEQCTGLKDKNGKLIYDNDYIRVINQDTKDRPDLQIGHIWVDELNCRWIKFAKEELSWNEFCSLIDYDLTLEIEVIGNIHENGDVDRLLK